MVFVDYIPSDRQQEASKISTYDEQLIAAKINATKRSAEPFFNYPNLYGFHGAKMGI